jgi:hypothetical protein
VQQRYLHELTAPPGTSHAFSRTSPHTACASPSSIVLTTRLRHRSYHALQWWPAQRAQCRRPPGIIRRTPSASGRRDKCTISVLTTTHARVSGSLTPTRTVVVRISGRSKGSGGVSLADRSRPTIGSRSRARFPRPQRLPPLRRPFRRSSSQAAPAPCLPAAPPPPPQPWGPRPSSSCLHQPTSPPHPLVSPSFTSTTTPHNDVHNHVKSQIIKHSQQGASCQLKPDTLASVTLFVPVQQQVLASMAHGSCLKPHRPPNEEVVPWAR